MSVKNELKFNTNWYQISRLLTDLGNYAHIVEFMILSHFYLLINIRCRCVNSAFFLRELMISLRIPHIVLKLLKIDKSPLDLQEPADIKLALRKVLCKAGAIYMVSLGPSYLISKVIACSKSRLLKQNRFVKMRPLMTCVPCYHTNSLNVVTKRFTFAF